MSASAPLVLVADDDVDIQTLAALRLERAGFRVLRAADGEAAWRLALEHRLDAAVLDLSMPKLDGLEVTQRLRDDPRTASLPVLLLTARAQQADEVRALAAGATSYMRKPFSAQDLNERVTALVEAR